jgi:uncharacterized protein involved in type VI secretion and phage assembly
MTEKTLVGVYRAVVTDASDPQQLGRVSIRIPSVSADEDLWARVVIPGKTSYLLDPGDEVLVAFEAGDLRAPYVLGTLWDPSDAPPEYGPGAG